MYTLTRKLSVICLTVVLSFLVYGCGGSSKQALITDVSTDMVTAGLTSDPGTYTIQPGGSANAGDVTFTCPAEGPSCEVTVAEDGTVTSAPGSAPGTATAMDSASAAARLVAEQRATDAEAARTEAENMRDAAVTARTEAENMRDAAVTARTEAENMRDAANTDRLAAEQRATDAEQRATDAEAAQMAAEQRATDAEAAQMAAENMRDAAVTAQMAAENMRDAAVTAQMEAETARMVAEAARMEAEDMRDAEETARMEADQRATEAETARMVAEAARMEADQRATEAETARMVAEAARMEAEDMRDAEETARMEADQRATEAETAQMAAEDMRDAAVTAQMAAEDMRDAAVTARMEAEDMRDAAVTARMEADQRVTEAETERDEANTTALAAVARAELLEMVNPFLVASAEGYGRVTPGVYEIAPGGTNTEPGDDITFACPADGPLCVVIVAVSEEGPSYTSLGGAATGTNSLSATATIAARALHSPAVGSVGDTGYVAGTEILKIDGINGPTTAVTRNTGGSETTITLTHTTGSTEANAVKYTSEAVDTGHKIDNWSGQTLKRSDDTNLKTPQEATVYTNIDPATPQKLKLGDGDTTVTTPGATSVFVLDSGQDDDATLNMDKSMFRAAYNGVPGKFTCEAGDTCANIVTDTDGNTGQRIILSSTSFSSTGWTFESDGYVEAVAAQDADHMYFGYWLQSPDPDPDVDPPVYESATDFGGANGGANLFTVESGLMMSRSDEALTATYEGGAAGSYVTRKLRIKDQGVDPQSPGYTGRFTARATLMAHFGTHEDFDADNTAIPPTVSTANTIGGTITDFRDGATDLGFEVTLQRTGVGTGEILEAMTMATFSETATSTAANGAGTWNGQFYGPNASDLVAADDKSTATDANTFPSGVAGEFNANSTYTAVVGAFAAEIQ